MKSIWVEKKKNELIVHVPCEEPWPSKSGKNMIVASTRGRLVTDILVEKQPLQLILNVFRARTKKEMDE